jgi:hypothetical protein
LDLCRFQELPQINRGTEEAGVKRNSGRAEKRPSRLARVSPEYEHVLCLHSCDRNMEYWPQLLPPRMRLCRIPRSAPFRQICPKIRGFSELQQLVQEVKAAHVSRDLSIPIPLHGSGSGSKMHSILFAFARACKADFHTHCPIL